MTDIEMAVPEQWKGIVRVLILPIQGVMQVQGYLLTHAWQSDMVGVSALKILFLLLPALAVVVGLWCTTLSAYALMFRNDRVRYIGTILVLWWDVARSTWLFWAGMGKFLFVLFGSFWGLLRLVVAIILEIIRSIFELPFVLTGRFTANLRSPGVPWLAFLMTVGWSALEAAIFAYILTPTMGELIGDLVGKEVGPMVTPMLFVVLFFLIAGSLACLQVLVEAIAEKSVKNIIQMAIVESFVMFFEVVFLYRELISSIAPWIAQQTGYEMGLVSTLALSSFGWVGIRAMVWFLFGRYGTPTLLAVISRQRLPEETRQAPAARQENPLDKVFAKLKDEQRWFQEQAQALLEAAVLPLFQLIATALNFAFVLFLSQPLFSVPIKNVGELGETRTLLNNMVSPKGVSR